MRLFSSLSAILLMACVIPCMAKAEDGSGKSLSYTDRRNYDLLFLEATTERMKDTCDAEAYELYEAASRINPAAADPYFWMGMIKLDHKQHSDTLVQGEIDELFAMAVANDSSNREFRKMQALNYAITGRMKEAIAAYENLPHLAQDEESIERLFELYFRTRNFDGAIDCLNKLEALNGSNERIGITKYQLYEMKGDKEGMYRAALALDAENLGARVLLIDILHRQNKGEEVIELCREGRLYHPTEIVYGYYEGVALLLLKKEEEALMAFQRSIGHINEESNKELAAYLYQHKGDVLHEIGRDAEAYCAYDTALAYKPDNLLALNNYAYFLALDGTDLEKAEQMSRQTIEKDSLNATYLDTYAWVLFRLARYEEALDVITRAEECFTTEDDSELRGTIYEHRADILSQLDRRKEAKKYWHLALPFVDDEEQSGGIEAMIND